MAKVTTLLLYLKLEKCVKVRLLLTYIILISFIKVPLELLLLPGLFDNQQPTEMPDEAAISKHGPPEFGKVLAIFDIIVTLLVWLYHFVLKNYKFRSFLKKLLDIILRKHAAEYVFIDLVIEDLSFYVMLLLGGGCDALLRFGFGGLQARRNRFGSWL